MARKTPRTWLRKRTAAERLGVTPRTIERYIDAGHLPAYKLPSGAVVVDAFDLDAMPHRVAVAVTQ